jgi:regulatory protein
LAFGQLSLKGRALRHLARREHSRAELERKLAPYAEEVPESTAAEQIRAALDDLAARGLLSDARVAESTLAGRGQRLGSRRLAQTLRDKGLAPELISATLVQARGSELARAQAIWQRRFGRAPADVAERARQMRFLAGRGFEADVIRRVLQGASSDTDATADETADATESPFDDDA